LVGRVTPCAPVLGRLRANGAHGVTRPTLRRIPIGVEPIPVSAAQLLQGLRGMRIGTLASRQHHAPVGGGKITSGGVHRAVWLTERPWSALAIRVLVLAPQVSGQPEWRAVPSLEEEAGCKSVFMSRRVRAPPGALAQSSEPASRGSN
jgi:hypothetical protein